MTSAREIMALSPGVVMARAPWAAPYSTAVCGPSSFRKAESLNVDLSISYDIGDHVTLSFEGINLTDQFDERWINSERQNNLNYEHTGREFVFGARYRF